MQNLTTNQWQPDRDSALAALKDFVADAGRDYASGRNFDTGPSERGSVSKLSPWIRLRLISEAEVVREVLSEHSATTAEKFIQEVCWRTYWKGWLHLRPGVWDDYLAARASLLEEYNQNNNYLSAINGQTGIDCFDAWIAELVHTGYLHNHARMWFASIWIHTLLLPWQLGADFFLRHLLDGDAASNTLGWRWVVGLQTLGKTYLATADNIKKFTHGRFNPVGQLASQPYLPDDLPQHPPPRELEPLSNLPKAGKTIGLLVTDDDLTAFNWISKFTQVSTVAGMLPHAAYAQLGIDESVVKFRQQAMQSRLESISLPIRHLSEEGSLASAVERWATEENLQAVCVAEPAVGICNDAFREVSDTLEKMGVALHLLRRPWDEAFYPHATKGFFKFKQQIPQILDQVEAFD